MLESGFNTTLFRLINDAHNPLLDGFFGIISGLGDGLVVALLCAVLVLYRLRLGMAAMLTYLLSGLVAQLIKHAVNVPRPPAVLDHVHVLGATLTSHSFPSGHATSDGGMLLAAFLLWGVRDARGWAVAALYLLAAIGRVYGGVHYPLDVAVGLTIGVSIMAVIWRWSASWPVARWQQSVLSWKLSGLLVAILAAVLGLGYHMQPSTAQPLAFVLPVIALVIVMRRFRELAGATHG